MPKKVRKSQSEEWDQSSSNGHTSRGTSTPRSRASRRSSLEDEDQLSADQTKMTSDRLQSALAEAAEDPIIRLIKDSVDNLGEKRASTREQALTTLMRSLSMRCTDEVEETIEGRQETIIMHLKRSIRRDASDRECVMACRVVVMMSALLHLQDECGWYSDVTGRLSAIISYEASDEKQQKQSFALLLQFDPFDWCFHEHLRLYSHLLKLMQHFRRGLSLRSKRNNRQN